MAEDVLEKYDREEGAELEGEDSGGRRGMGIKSRYAHSVYDKEKISLKSVIFIQYPEQIVYHVIKYIIHYNAVV